MAKYLNPNMVSTEAMFQIMQKAVEAYVEAPALDGMSVEFCDVVVPALKDPSQTITVTSISPLKGTGQYGVSLDEKYDKPDHTQVSAYEYYVAQARQEGSVVRHRELEFEYHPVYKAYIAYCPHCKFTYKFFVADEFLYSFDPSSLVHYISSRLLESEEP